MKNYGIQHSTVKPASMEITETKVFLYKDITEIQTEDGVQYEFDLVEYDKDEYIIHMSEKVEVIKKIKVQSDKLGYDWEITMVGELECMKEYVAQTDPKGTSEDNPIIWEEGMTPINNAYYLKPDGKIYVYMNGEWIEW